MDENNIERKTTPDPTSCEVLLQHYGEADPGKIGNKLTFYGIDGKDIYNITPPFLNDGVLVIAARVEAREDQAHSEVCFFKSLNDSTDFVWTKIDINPLNLQDPFVTFIDGQIIVGGVEVSPPPFGSEDNSLTYRTVFYKGKSLSTLEKSATGPEKMKDIRIIRLPNGHIGVFTRPQGHTNGGGKIGYIELDSLEDLNDSANFLKAKIIEGQFALGEWGGANQLHLLPGGKIGVIGHIACFDEEENKHYYGMSFVFDPESDIASPLKIIATREDFPSGPSKKPDLGDVIFVGGIYEKDGQWYLYAGLGDVESGVIPIEYPFGS